MRSHDAQCSVEQKKLTRNFDSAARNFIDCAARTAVAALRRDGPAVVCFADDAGDLVTDLDFGSILFKAASLMSRLLGDLFCFLFPSFPFFFL